MSTEARRASLPPRPPHAPRTAGNPGPFDPRTPLEPPAPEDTDRVAARRPASDEREPSGARDAGTATPRASDDTGAPRTERPSGTVAAQRGAAPADPTSRPATSAASDARGAGAEEGAYRPTGNGTVGAQRPAPDARRDGDSRGGVPADPTSRPATSAASDARGAGAEEGAYRPSGNGTVGAQRPAPDARRDGDSRGGVPADPTSRPATPAASGTRGAGTTGRPTTTAPSDARRTGAASADPTYRPTGDSAPDRKVTPSAPAARPRFPRIGDGTPDRTAPPPPQASARFPDAPPTVGRGVPVTSDSGRGMSAPPSAPPAPSVPPRPAHRPRTEAPAETRSETTTRLRPVPAEPDPALSWSAPMSPGGVPGAGRPAVTFGEPDSRPRPFARRTRGQVVAAAVCLVLGTGLIGGAVTGAWLADGPEGPGTRHAFAVAGDLWHEVPVDQLFPPTVQGRGAGPGEADRVWTRIAVAPDSGCKGAFDALLSRALAPVGCERLLRATYTDATQSHVTTVGLLFTEADAPGMEALARRFDRERLDRRSDLMPMPYGAKGTAAEGFGPEQRASWAISVLTDAPVVVYAVSGWADGRPVDEPQPAEDAMQPGATSAPAQAGLGHEARGLADRFERALRQRAGTPTERPS
ncbi:hypothetical protein SUDANB21_01181 [Streptomyces sp. enrichment culture]|uniref:hypothetical protein n=1 Tax=Streptomyces sp. MD20-1-1 TaxID=3028668 RepID=UPI0029BC7184|nr:hypothetical protein [Streptomyces sp. MD20-1-1]